MRHLSVKQKKLIKEYIIENGEHGLENFNIFIHDVLEPLNDFETLWQHARNYASDVYDELLPF